MAPSGTFSLGGKIGSTSAASDGAYFLEIVAPQFADGVPSAVPDPCVSAAVEACRKERLRRRADRLRLRRLGALF